MDLIQVLLFAVGFPIGLLFLGLLKSPSRRKDHILLLVLVGLVLTIVPVITLAGSVAAIIVFAAVI